MVNERLFRSKKRGHVVCATFNDSRSPFFFSNQYLFFCVAQAVIFFSFQPGERNIDFWHFLNIKADTEMT